MKRIFSAYYETSALLLRYLWPEGRFSPTLRKFIIWKKGESTLFRQESEELAIVSPFISKTILFVEVLVPKVDLVISLESP